MATYSLQTSGQVQAIHGALSNHWRKIRDGLAVADSANPDRLILNQQYELAYKAVLDFIQNMEKWVLSGGDGVVVSHDIAFATRRHTSYT